VRAWWLVLMSRSRRDSATTGLGNSGYQSAGARLDVRIMDFPARSVISSYRSSAWAAVSSRMAKSSRTRTEPVKLNETSGGWIYPTALLGLDGGAGLVDPDPGGQGRG